MLETAALVAVGYVLGSMPWGLWVPRVLSGVDVRTLGSGNTGATNVWRALGFKLGLAVALLDIAKGLAPALLARWLADDQRTITCDSPQMVDAITRLSDLILVDRATGLSPPASIRNGATARRSRRE